MSAVALSLANLGDLSNGQAGAVIDAALAAAIRDAEDRGTDDKPRKVIVTVSITKISDDNMAIEVEAKTSVPAYVTDKTIGQLSYAGAGKGPKVVFQSMSADRPDQQTLDFPNEKAE